MGSDILTVEELHTYLKIPRPTLYTLAQQGRIPAAKVGKHWRFKKSSIDRWLREQHAARAAARKAQHAAGSAPLAGDAHGHR